MTPYATAADLEAWLFGPAPATADRLLARASELVKHHALGMPVTVDEITTEILMQATCAQVEQWMATGEDNAIAGRPVNTQMSVGGMSIGAQPATLAPRAFMILQSGNLIQPYEW